MPGPWRVVGTDSESLDGVASCPLHEGGEYDACDSCSVIETHSEWVALYVAALSPEIGRALADVLDDLAQSYEHQSPGMVELMLGGMASNEHRVGSPHPVLRLARLILGGGS